MSSDYNKKSKKRLGWKFSWLGLDDDRWDLVTEKVKEFQKKNQLLEDGKLGPHTFSVLEGLFADKRKYILCNDEKVHLDWDKVIRFDEKGGLNLKKSVYTEKKDRYISQIVTHWDVCLSASDCVRVLNRRKASTHFVIDNDGTIYQLLDPKHRAWHTGFHDTNKLAIGIDISNAYYLKYQKTYVSRGFGERPIIKDATVRGKKLDPFLGFYDEQIAAYSALLKALTSTYSIPKQTHESASGETSDTYYALAGEGKASGIYSHYHVDKRKRKIDCAGLDIKTILEEIKEEDE